MGRAVQEVAEAAGFSVVREYVGHAIGTAMHEEPQVPNYWPGSGGPTLKTGMVFAVEPMVNAGGPGTVQLDDGWSVVTADGRLSAHFEHTIAVTETARRCSRSSEPARPRTCPTTGPGLGPTMLDSGSDWQFGANGLNWSFGWPRLCGGVPIPLLVVLLWCAPDCGADERRQRRS